METERETAGKKKDDDDDEEEEDEDWLISALKVMRWSCPLRLF